jgi:hypothetical protein
VIDGAGSVEKHSNGHVQCGVIDGAGSVEKPFGAHGVNEPSHDDCHDPLHSGDQSNHSESVRVPDVNCVLVLSQSVPMGVAHSERQASQSMLPESVPMGFAHSHSRASHTMLPNQTTMWLLDPLIPVSDLFVVLHECTQHCTCLHAPLKGDKSVEVISTLHEKCKTSSRKKSRSKEERRFRDCIQAEKGHTHPDPALRYIEHAP